MAVRERRITGEEFEDPLALPANSSRLLELTDREIVEEIPTWEHGVVTADVAIAAVIVLRDFTMRADKVFGSV